jgi:hypothetical protein
MDAEKSSVDVGLRLFYLGTIEEVKSNFDSNPSGGIDSYKFSGLTRASGEQTLEAKKTAFLAFIDELKENGTTLSEDGGDRLAFYAFRQADVFANISTPEAWHRALARLRSLNVFSENEVTVTVTEIPAAQKKTERTAAIIEKELDALAVQTETPAVNARRHALLKELRLLEFTDLAVIKPLWTKFCQFIHETYPAFDFNAQLQIQATDWLGQRGLPMDHYGLNRMRREFLKLFSNEELLCQQIEGDDRPASDYSFKRDMRRAQLRNQG